MLPCFHAPGDNLAHNLNHPHFLAPAQRQKLCPCCKSRYQYNTVAIPNRVRLPTAWAVASTEVNVDGREATQAAGSGANARHSGSPGDEGAAAGSSDGDEDDDLRSSGGSPGGSPGTSGEASSRGTVTTYWLGLPLDQMGFMYVRHNLYAQVAFVQQVAIKLVTYEASYQRMTEVGVGFGDRHECQGS